MSVRLAGTGTNVNVDTSLAGGSLHERADKIRRTVFTRLYRDSEVEREVFAFGSFLLDSFVNATAPFLQTKIHSRRRLLQDYPQRYFRSLHFVRLRFNSKVLSFPSPKLEGAQPFGLGPWQLPRHGPSGRHR